MKLCFRDRPFQSNVCNFQGFSGVISNEGDIKVQLIPTNIDTKGTTCILYLCFTPSYR